MNFDRWATTFERSWAYIIFIKHHTEINSYYWAHRAAFKAAFGMTASKSKLDSVHTVFPDPKKERKREITLGKWAADYNGLDNWIRLSAVVAISGYLEVYVKTIVDAACQSCPAVLIGGAKEIEGVKLLKNRPDYSFSEEAELFMKGTWQQRAPAYRKIFGSCPAFIESHFAELEQFRILRNAVGHAFGRNPDIPAVGEHILKNPVKSVSQDRLKSFLHLAYEVAQAIESHLAGAYVGSYELIALYHQWENKSSGIWAQERDSFKEYIVTATGRSLKKDYITDMFKYYHAVV